jgi:hypothetical protein
MRLCVLLVAGALLINTAAVPAIAGDPGHSAAIQAGHADDMSAAKRKAKKQSGHQAYGRSGTQIACTPFGCNPIPRGCRVRPGMNPFTWNPTGFDEIVCPYPR